MDDEIVLEGINSGHSFRVEKLNTEAAEIVAEAREKYPDAKTNSPGGRYITKKTVHAILLSSNSLMEKLGFLSDTSDYRAAIESATSRLKTEDMMKLIEKFEEVNKDFLSRMKTKAAGRTSESVPATSPPQPSTTPSNTPPA